LHTHHSCIANTTAFYYLTTQMTTACSYAAQLSPPLLPAALLFVPAHAIKLLSWACHPYGMLYHRLSIVVGKNRGHLFSLYVL
jgi:hypothetical protein